MLVVHAVNFICVRLFAVGNYYAILYTSDVVMEARASLGLSSCDHYINK
jgi:hypothetical protein